jgi:hypothetical protein
VTQLEPKPHFITISQELDLVYVGPEEGWQYIRYTKKGVLKSELFDTKLQAFLTLAKGMVEWHKVLSSA